MIAEGVAVDAYFAVDGDSTKIGDMVCPGGRARIGVGSKVDINLSVGGIIGRVWGGRIVVGVCSMGGIGVGGRV